MPISEVLNKKTYVVCPNCSTINIATRFLGMWSMPICPTCTQKININSIRCSTVTCDSCGNSIIYNALSSAPQLCPNCKSPLINPVNRPRFRVVPCPQCGSDVQVTGQTGMVPCPVCSHSFDISKALELKKQQESHKPILIQYGANTQDILWKHPQNSFPQGSKLIVKEGSAAILLENGRLSCIADPGKYDLEDTVLSLSEKLMLPSGSFCYLTDIFFVQKRISQEYKWGTAFPSEIRDDIGTYTVSASGSLNLRVTDPRALAEHLNFSDVTLSGNNPDPNARSGLIEDLVVKQTGLCFGAPLQEIITRNRWSLRTLVKTDLQNSIVDPLNKLLSTFGLIVEPNTFFIESLSCQETRQSTSDRMKQEGLIRAIEKPILWSAGQLRIHKKDDPSKYADIELDGSVTPRIDNLQLLMDSSLGRSMTSDLVTFHFSTQELQNELSRILHDLMEQILQPMIDDTGVDIRELGRYYTYLKKTTIDCLNYSLKRFGLSFENVTFEQKSFIASQALSNEYKSSSEQSRMLDAEEMRRFTQKIKLVEKQETGEYEVEILRAEVEAGEKMDPLKDRASTLKHNELVRNEAEATEKMKSTTRLLSLQYENDMVILRKQFAEDLAVEEHKVDMRDMLHKIDQSDLDWTQKLAEYNRLWQNITVQDEMIHQVEGAKASAEAKHIMLQYTTEEQELLQALKDREAERIESKEQADFERKLTIMKTEWEAKTEMLKLGYDLDKYKYELDYLSNVDFHKVAFEIAKAAAEKEYAERIRAQKDRDDASFVNRSNELMSQIRAFRSELTGYPDGMRKTAERVIPNDVFESLLVTLQSVVASVSSSMASRSSVNNGSTLSGKTQNTNEPFTPNRII